MVENDLDRNVAKNAGPGHAGMEIWLWQDNLAWKDRHHRFIQKATYEQQQ